MFSLKHLRLLLCLCAIAVSQSANALDCQSGTELSHTFDSGANWRFCAVLDDDHALEIQELHYQAPGDSSRKVLQHLHLGQVLLHQHDQSDVQSLMGNTNNLGGTALKTLDSRVCEGELHTLGLPEAKLCSTVLPTGLLAKFSMRPGLQGERYQLFSVSNFDGLTFQIMIGLGEDGRITPSVTLSGQSRATTDNASFGNAVINPLDNQAILATQASLLYTWRMVFALNGDQRNDIVDEFNFELNPDQGSRRPMSITTLSTETLRNIDQNAFRGWRIKDEDGRGYYLDPQNSGYAFSDRINNWAQFDIALTAFNVCERHSRIQPTTADNVNECVGSLDDFVNGEPMNDTKPVLWYSLSRVHRPSAEDFPIISSMVTEFELIPFDWTPTSPFEVRDE